VGHEGDRAVARLVPCERIAVSAPDGSGSMFALALTMFQSLAAATHHSRIASGTLSLSG